MPVQATNSKKVVQYSQNQNNRVNGPQMPKLQANSNSNDLRQGQSNQSNLLAAQLHQKNRLENCLDLQGANSRHIHQSEYASMGRQGSGFLQVQQNVITEQHHEQGYKNKTRMQYESPKHPSVKVNMQPSLRQSQVNPGIVHMLTPSLPTVTSENKISTKSKQSFDNSEEFNQVADEDQSSFIKYRNAYLDDEIQPSQELQFKQEPKLGKGTRPNPNLYQTPTLQVNRLNSQQTYTSPISQVQNQQIVQQKQAVTNKRIFETNKIAPAHNVRETNSQIAIQRPIQMPSHKKASSGSQITNNLNQGNFNKNGGRRIIVQTKNQVELAQPAAERIARAETQIAILPMSSKLTQNNKLNQNNEFENSTRQPHPMFQRLINDENSNSKKHAMIHQFEMNLAPRNNAAAQVYSQREKICQSGSNVMNKATNFDSSGSKQHNNTTGSNSQFLRKQLWLLTNTKSRTLKDLLQIKQPACALCTYIHSYSHFTIAANFGQSSANKAVNSQSIFKMDTKANLNNGNENYFQIQTGITGQTDLQRMVVNHQMSSLETNTRSNQNSKLLVTESTRHAKSLHQQIIPSSAAVADKIVTNSRMNLKIHSPRSPQSPGTPTNPHQNSDVYVPGRRLIRRVNNQQQNNGSSMLSTSNASANGLVQYNANIQVSSGSACPFFQQMTSVIMHQELYDRFETQYFNFLLKRSLIQKYMTSQEYYNSKVASDIMYNEQRHIVSVFKEYLIFDDFSEYLKRFYTNKESQERLPRIFEFYENYSKVFPNYVALPESKLMFKNIEKKQKLIDQRHQNFLRNQKKEKGEMSKSEFQNSVLMLFNSQFLKEVYDEPTLHDSMLTDPREKHDISINQFSRVLNNPPIQKLIEDQSTQNLNQTRNHKELENIINLLNRFDRIEDTSIMAREIISNSLNKGSAHYQTYQSLQDPALLTAQSKDEQKSRQLAIRIQTHQNDVTISSWAIQSIQNDQQMLLRQDSEFELNSELFCQSNNSLIENRKTPKISTLPHPRQVFTRAKPFAEHKNILQQNNQQDQLGPNQLKLTDKQTAVDLTNKLQQAQINKQAKDYLHGEIKDLTKPSQQRELASHITEKLTHQKQEKVNLLQTQSIKGINLKQINIAPSQTESQPNGRANSRHITRNKEFIQDKPAPSQIQQHLTQTSSASSAAVLLMKPGTHNSIKDKQIIAQNEQQNFRSQSRTQTGVEMLIQGSQIQSKQKNQTKESLDNEFQLSEGTQAFKQNLQNLMKENKKIYNSAKKDKNSFAKRNSVIEQNFMSTNQLLDNVTFQDKRNLQFENKTAITSSACSRNEKVQAERKSDSQEETKKQITPSLQLRTTMQRFEPGKHTTNGDEYDLKEIQKLAKNCSRTSLLATATHQPQQLTKHKIIINTNQEDQLSQAKTKQISKQENQEQPIGLELHDEKQTRFKISTKFEQTEGRKIKTSIDIRDSELNFQERRQQYMIKKPTISQEQKQLHMKQLEPPHSNKISKNSIQQLLSTQPISQIAKISSITKTQKNFIAKPQLDIKVSNFSNGSKAQKLAANNVYTNTSSHQPLITNNLTTPYNLINYYSSDTNDNHSGVESQRNLYGTMHFQSPEMKERTSKSENLQKNNNLVGIQQHWNEKTPQRLQSESISQGLMAESATLAAQKYFQTNQKQNQNNPYDKTGRVMSAVSTGSASNSGKGSAGGTQNFILTANASKGRNKLPNGGKIIAVKLNAAQICKPTSSLSQALQNTQNLSKKMDSQVVQMNSLQNQGNSLLLPKQGGTGGSVKSGMSAPASILSSKQSIITSGNAQQLYQSKINDPTNLYMLAQKSSVLLKKSTPSSTTSSAKVKKKQVTITNKINPKGGKEGLIKKVQTGIQGHTIFSVNPSRPTQ